MAVKLRLRRMGKKRQPIYKLVAADERAPRDGRYIEAIGSYNPKTNPSTVEIDQERALYWLDVGAIPTTTVKNLLNAEGILYKKELLRSGKSEAEIDTAMEEWNKKKEAKLQAAMSKTEKLKAEKEKAKAKEKEEAEKAEAEKVEAEKAEAAAQKKEAEETPAAEAEPKADASEQEAPEKGEENSENEDKKD